MNSEYSQRQNPLLNQLRLLWSQHVYWTRFFIISTVAGLNDSEAVTQRLLQNPNDFARLLTPFYGISIAKYFNDLFTQHLLIAADFVTAAKNKETDRANAIRRKWYENADDIASFLANINPFWNEAKWKDMLYQHLDMTEKEVLFRLDGNYPEDIKIFDSIEQEALLMADYMYSGIAQQFL